MLEAKRAARQVIEEIGNSLFQRERLFERKDINRAFQLFD